MPFKALQTEPQFVKVVDELDDEELLDELLLELEELLELDELLELEVEAAALQQHHWPAGQ